MMWKGQWVVLLVSCVLFSSCADGNMSKEASDATNQFSLDLLKTVCQNETGSTIISPVSVYTLLAILQQGAIGNSSKELNSVLHAHCQLTKQAYRNLTTKYQEPVPLTTLEFAIRAFVSIKYNVKHEFRQNLMHNFHSNAESINFNDSTAPSEHRINTWVSEGTHQRINELFLPGSIPDDSLLVLVNTIYFNSYWDNPFYDVEDRSFSPRSGEVVYVPTFYQEEFYPGGESNELGAKYVHVKFEHSADFSMLLVLPNERYGLDNVVNRLTVETLTSLFPYGESKKVKLQWPKFRLNTDTQLIPVLKRLGLDDIFKDSANFTGISTKPMKVSKVVQKAEIAVDENGVTASAATGVIGQPASLHVVPNAENMEFIADHPFLFFIVDRKNAVLLFAGRVSNPRS